MAVVSRAVSTLGLLLGGGGLFAILLCFQTPVDTETGKGRGTCPLLCGAGMGSWPAWHPCPLPQHVFHAIPGIKTRACEIQREASDLVVHWSCFIEERIEVQNSNWWPEFICWFTHWSSWVSFLPTWSLAFSSCPPPASLHSSVQSQEHPPGPPLCGLPPFLSTVAKCGVEFLLVHRLPLVVFLGYWIKSPFFSSFR